MSIVFDDGPYSRSHMKRPKGRGSWAFADDLIQDDVRFFQGTLTEAKKQARKFFASQPAPSYGDTTIVVILP